MMIELTNEFDLARYFAYMADRPEEATKIFEHVDADSGSVILEDKDAESFIIYAAKLYESIYSSIKEKDKKESSTLENAKKAWTAEEDAQLKKLFAEGEDDATIAVALKRTINAVKKRRSKLIKNEG